VTIKQPVQALALPVFMKPQSCYNFMALSATYGFVLRPWNNQI